MGDHAPISSNLLSRVSCGEEMQGAAPVRLLVPSRRLDVDLEPLLITRVGRHGVLGGLSK